MLFYRFNYNYFTKIASLKKNKTLENPQNLRFSGHRKFIEFSSEEIKKFKFLGNINSEHTAP